MSCETLSLECQPTGITTHNKELQRGLVPKDKAARVASYAKKVAYGVGLIAHSCGVAEPRRLRRHHMRLMEADGRSVNMAELYPEPEQRIAVADGAGLTQ